MVEKTVELTGSSVNSIEDAVRIAVARAGVTIAGVRAAQIVNIAAVVEDNQVALWKVTLKLTFKVQEQIHD